VRQVSFAAFLACSSLVGGCSPASLWAGNRISKGTDASTGKAQVRLEEMALSVTAATQVYLAAIWDERSADAAVIAFRITRADCVNPTDGALLAVIDGKQVAMARLGDNLVVRTGARACELDVEATLPRDALVALAASPTVVLRVDSAYFRLLSHHLDSLKQFVAALPARGAGGEKN
jgi:hypothetical protein